MVHTLQMTNNVKANILENIRNRFDVIRKYIPESNAHTFMWHVTYLNAFARHLIQPKLAESRSHKFDVWLTVHRNSVWIRNQLDVTFVLSFISSLQIAQ